jgi:hypothetical protein
MGTHGQTDMTNLIVAFLQISESIKCVGLYFESHVQFNAAAHTVALLPIADNFWNAILRY